MKTIRCSVEVLGGCFSIGEISPSSYLTNFSGKHVDLEKRIEVFDDGKLIKTVECKSFEPFPEAFDLLEVIIGPIVTIEAVLTGNKRYEVIGQNAAGECLTGYGQAANALAAVKIYSSRWPDHCIVDIREFGERDVTPSTYALHW